MHFRISYYCHGEPNEINPHNTLKEHCLTENALQVVYEWATGEHYQ